MSMRTRLAPALADTHLDGETKVTDRSAAPEGTGSIKVSGVGYGYPGVRTGQRVIDDLEFSVRPGEFVCIVGPSGCGKTTLLKLLSGLIAPEAGSILVNDEAVSGPPENLGFVFQDHGRALLPWRNAVRNVEFSLEAARVPRRRRKDMARDALRRVHLPDVENLYPAQMSGGMQQRLQIARALAATPSVLLMDEPFAALDALTRFALEDALLEVWQELGLTVVFVTHDLDEAIYLADRVIVLRRGPAHVVREVRVDLERPRDQGRTRAEKDFVALRYELFETIRTL
ncbi:ABC transporter ATP-binding protein [Phytoactinopolyspora endophytica]|uniref:ABC transporter ATP-binding protein n=1 Tax=Phytoactinopolyspora endophytica TaxID=1642495 RepID=UPI00197C3373|nr:ABC transporter ATP-binding protein [Phytoactinopolyspora endophytica]